MFVLHFAGNVVFPDPDSASRAILGLGTVAPPEETPDGFGEAPHALPKQFLVWLQAYSCILGVTPAYHPFSFIYTKEDKKTIYIAIDRGYAVSGMSSTFYL